ncbi:MAG: aminoglycoside phosphotransferase family protein, partial [Saprospiraceae bacterium]
MQSNNHIEKLSKMFQEHFGLSVFTTETFPHTASGRHYFRLVSESGFSAIGAYGNNRKENEAFIYFSKHFHAKGINVPQIYADDLEEGFYLIQDLGGESLMDRNKKIKRINNIFPNELKQLYKKTIQGLIKIQTEGIKDLNTSYCHPRNEFDEQSMQWDLNYFKYYFLNLSGIEYDEQLLENDFNELIKYLSRTENNYFLFRDFQSRNVMLVNDEPYFIDYQGGRKGCLQYDLTSLLFQSKANIPQEVREELIDFYFNEINKITSLNKKEFTSYFYGFTLIRLIQVLGAYGKRGLLEKMPYFIQSIPLGLENMKWWLDNINLPV